MEHPVKDFSVLIFCPLVSINIDRLLLREYTLCRVNLKAIHATSISDIHPLHGSFRGDKYEILQRLGKD
jgi:hypothetical protein